MRHSRYSRHCILAVLAVASAVGGCATRKQDVAADSITPQAPFSRTFTGSADTVCWSVKRALLSQGYMLDRGGDAGVVTGTRDFQPQPKINVSIRLQTSCADNRDGTSIVFVTANREESRLQKMKQSTSVGVGPATLTMPSGSAQVLGVVRRETVRDPAFYDRFFKLIADFATQERAAESEKPHEGDRQAEVQAPTPRSDQ